MNWRYDKLRGKIKEVCGTRGCVCRKTWHRKSVIKPEVEQSIGVFTR